ncbi:hypothetical protein ABEB36_008165 [Hypothenemus hampei]|uniref:PH domain-containing protein n=1 Tax=Hypothenemus hampei TaxID=57062 RepID=A0ABD1ENX2_HYPHA
MDPTVQQMDMYLKQSTGHFNEAQMTSSTISTISSLASPVDSGVQLLDSESEHTSVMSGGDTVNETDLSCNNGTERSQIDTAKGTAWKDIEMSPAKFTDSDFANKNVIGNVILSKSAPNYFDKFSDKETSQKGVLGTSKSFSDEIFEMEHPIKSNTEVDVMNLSLNSYELLDYTLQNANLSAPSETEQIDMHISMSEEVNENLKVVLDGKEAVTSTVTSDVPIVENPETKPPDEQIVFRRQRKKKTKSDTPKKRVSFHEDILNSMKIDDIHINLGFVTHEPDVSLNFFQRGFIRKPDVVKGRYSWAAEGDAPYYEKADTNRQIKSDLYVQHPRGSSSSSSSTGSVSSSIDEEDSGSDDYTQQKLSEPTFGSQPKSSCLKKTKQRKIIDTKIVQEDIGLKKKSESNLLIDSNIFGSLKNILNFSTSVPLAERGVPEGQEDVAIYSSSQDLSGRRKSFGNFSFLQSTAVEVQPEPVANKMLLSKTNLKLTKNEGFYPNYNNEDVPPNVILCNSNVYEHKGISYSYEYDNFQKSFEKQQPNKSSMMYQRILKEFNFFRRRAKPEPETEEFEIINEQGSPLKTQNKAEDLEAMEAEPQYSSTPSTKTDLSKYTSSTKYDWSDNETVFSDISDTRNSRHLDSPKRKISRNNHYTVQSPFKVSQTDISSVSNLESIRSFPNLKPASSKTSLINRFLRNVTLKKMMEVKSRGSIKNSRNYLGLCPKVRCIPQNFNHDLNLTIEKEIITGSAKKSSNQAIDKMTILNLKSKVFHNKCEELLQIFPVRSAYTTSGFSRPLLLILTTRAFYVTALNPPPNSYHTYFVLPYTDLNTILIGPNAQLIHFSNYDADMQCILTTGCSQITGEIISRIEIAMRRDNVNKPQLAAVKHLSMGDMANLRNVVCKQTSVDKYEEYFYYSIVNIQDFVSEELPSIIGPSKEGPLMFKTSDCESGRWETAYFILKAGVLYMLSSVSQRIPMRVFPLINGACQGARRIVHSHRPHTFQLVVDGKTLLLAAPDEYVASEWLQKLIHAASGVYQCKYRNLTQSCTLLMTNDHILTVREAFSSGLPSLVPPKTLHEPEKGPQILSCASITDLVSFRLPSAEQSWCVLEFSCREVHEYTGDWIIYFSTNAELEVFISTLEMLWQYNNEHGDSFPLSTIPDTDPLSIKCIDTYKSLMESHLTNTVHLQFL